MRRMGIAGALLAGLFGGLTVMPSAQGADFHGTNCPGAPWACLWKEKDFNTEGNRNNYFKFKMYFRDGRDFNFANTGYPVHDRSSSGVNDATGRDIWMYNSYNCSGSETIHRGPEWWDGDFSNDTPLDGGAFNDSISSASFDNYLSSCQ